MNEQTNSKWFSSENHRSFHSNSLIINQLFRMAKRKPILRKAMSSIWRSKFNFRQCIGIFGISTVTYGDGSMMAILKLFQEVTWTFMASVKHQDVLAQKKVASAGQYQRTIEVKWLGWTFMSKTLGEKVYTS